MYLGIISETGTKEIKRIEGTPLTSLHNQKKISYDIHFCPDNSPKQVILFTHGFKGFKDWGHFNLIAHYFAKAGFVFVKMNFSHNGTSPEHLTDFVDLEAFGNNNFSIELDDLSTMIDHIVAKKLQIPENEYNPSEIHLIGHSKGGSTCIIQACEDNKIKSVVSWAAVCNIIDRYSKNDVSDWKEKGVIYIHNTRTSQDMPLYYQLAEDVLKNKERFNIPAILANYTKKLLVIHGDDDTSVSIDEAREIHKACSHSELSIIKDAGHIFGGVHPWELNTLPEHTIELCNKTILFLKSC